MGKTDKEVAVLPAFRRYDEDKWHNIGGWDPIIGPENEIECQAAIDLARCFVTSRRDNEIRLILVEMACMLREPCNLFLFLHP